MVFATRFCILKYSKFNRFYKVSRRFEIALWKPSLGNAFLIISEPIFDFWLRKSQNWTGFIRVFATRFCILKYSKFDRFYKVFRRFEIVSREPSLGNAFLIISESISDFGLQKSQNSTGFIRYFYKPLRKLQNIVLLKVLDDSGGYFCRFCSIWRPAGPGFGEIGLLEIPGFFCSISRIQDLGPETEGGGC